MTLMVNTSQVVHGLMTGANEMDRAGDGIVEIRIAGAGEFVRDGCGIRMRRMLCLLRVQIGFYFSLPCQFTISLLCL